MEKDITTKDYYEMMLIPEIRNMAMSDSKGYIINMEVLVEYYRVYKREQNCRISSRGMN